MRYLYCLLLTVFLSPFSYAVVDLYEFDSEVQHKRYQQFVEELRCPKCQNQNLSGSNSPIASDLRREVHRLIIGGATDDEIIEFMVARYGEYVLYKPRAKGVTLLLWLAPAALLVFGLLIVGWLLWGRKPDACDELDQTIAEPSSELTAEQKNQLQQLLQQSEASDQSASEVR